MPAPREYLDYIAPGTGRKFQITENPDGTSTITDVTEYTQLGTDWAASDAKAIWTGIDAKPNADGTVQENLNAEKLGGSTLSEIIAEIPGQIDTENFAVKNGALQTNLNADMIDGSHLSDINTTITNTTDALQAQINALKAQEDTTIEDVFVDNVNGLDTNDGRTAGTAFATLTKALTIARTNIIPIKITLAGNGVENPYVFPSNDYSKYCYITINGSYQTSAEYPAYLQFEPSAICNVGLELRFLTLAFYSESGTSLFGPAQFKSSSVFLAQSKIFYFSANAIQALQSKIIIYGNEITFVSSSSTTGNPLFNGLYGSDIIFNSYTQGGTLTNTWKNLNGDTLTGNRVNVGYGCTVCTDWEFGDNNETIYITGSTSLYNVGVYAMCYDRSGRFRVYAGGVFVNYGSV